jgi:hypothetical protein
MIKEELMFDLALEKNVTLRLHEAAENAPSQQPCRTACLVCRKAGHG